MDTNTFMSAAALAVSFIAAVGPTTWAIIRYYKDKRVEYARKAADIYYKALTKANCLDVPLDSQELTYASLMLEAAIGHNNILWYELSDAFSFWSCRDGRAAALALCTYRSSFC